MDLLVPKDQAINILNAKLNELYISGFNWKVWQNSTVIDMKQIFGISDQWIQISHIHFIEAYIPAHETIPKAKEDAAGLLKSYIQQIENYSKITDQKVQVSNAILEKKYYELLNKYNLKIQENGALTNLQTSSIEENSKLKIDLNESQSEIKRLIDITPYN